MFELPVRKSKLGVRWHREHLVASDMGRSGHVDEDEDEEEDVVDVDSDVTCKTFCIGLGFGLTGDAPYAAAV